MTTVDRSYESESRPRCRSTGTRSGLTNCPMVSANNVDQELGWCREEFKKIGVEYAYFRHAPENNWYPHYIHNIDNLVPRRRPATRRST